jgi:hypothetical protein
MFAFLIQKIQKKITLHNLAFLENTKKLKNIVFLYFACIINLKISLLKRWEFNLFKNVYNVVKSPFIGGC